MYPSNIGPEIEQVSNDLFIGAINAYRRFTHADCNKLQW